MRIAFPHRLFVAPLVLAMLAPAALAAGPYLEPAAVVAAELLPPPPAPDSAEGKADLASAHAIYAAATAADRDAGRAEDHLKPFQLTADSVPWFQAGRFPRTEALLHEVEVETRTITSAGKNIWRRLRPYHVAPADFPDAIEHEEMTDYSYPSGHSTRGTVFAFVLAELFPAQREAILARGREAGWLRVQGGVHYPSDILAGRVLGLAIGHALMRSPAFQADLAAARAELAAGRR